MALTLTAEVALTTGGAIWSNANAGGFSIGASADVNLVRDAANAPALRNGVSPQTLNVYNTYTDSSNYERLTIRSSGTTFQLFVNNAGTGTARNFEFGVNGAVQWRIGTTGRFESTLNNTYDLGEIGSSAPRNISAGTAFIMADGVTAPTATVGAAKLFVDTADGDLKIIFGDGTIKTIVTDT